MKEEDTFTFNMAPIRVWTHLADLGADTGKDVGGVACQLLQVARRQLIDAVWGDGWVGDEHLVDVHVGHLRRKLGDDAAASKYIRTVRGVGYRMGDGTPPRNASGRR